VRSSKTYAAFKRFNGGLFVVFGLAIGAQIVHGVGMRYEAMPGIVLGAALIGLGIVRLLPARAA